METPIEVTIDPLYPVCYVRYLEPGERDGSLELGRDPDGVVRDRAFEEPDRPWTGVLIDVQPDDEIIGIEILNADDPVMVALARDYAADNDLAFPADLRAAAKTFA